MKVIKKSDNHFTFVSNTLARDNRLSWKARGIFIYMWSMPADWQFYAEELETHAPEGRDALAKGLKELEKLGYLKRIQTKGKNGKFRTKNWEITDTPAFSPQTGFPSTGKPSTDKPSTENPQLLSTNELSTDELNTNQREKHSPAKAEPPIDFQKVIEYLNLKSGKHFRDTSSNRELIRSRLNEGFTHQDIKTAIDHVVQAWLGTDMEQYIRPSTIFRASKFEGYVNDTPYPPSRTGRPRIVERLPDWAKEDHKPPKPKKASEADRALLAKQLAEIRKLGEKKA
ncbi:conserved phage C-terminal domain-containing protein [Lactobacillus rhamnosus]|uniref:Conserved phage C-terminal domain-containing protein n=1 Tax=Lacticaseibacillus rhamnosus TaxID=47715 RepID=A0A7Y7QGZ6_LACRH|nr:conserved phage C-terminal domain-containing protein [Lacticaseibacillus rhamnosus]NVO88919.1 conserved phage C-terminal domain-containing protein [Lacticaseibacillus rhamnosus]